MEIHTGCVFEPESLHCHVSPYVKNSYHLPSVTHMMYVTGETTVLIIGKV